MVFHAMGMHCRHDGDHINPEIYGHFSEHLGRCIYNGIYVGEDSSIPNICGMPSDSALLYTNGYPQRYRACGKEYSNHFIHMDCRGEEAFLSRAGFPPYDNRMRHCTVFVNVR